ncbi:NADH dehydrogenase [ubiquinone] 1 beta subcomplex subunit 6-like [Branchiostoma lanceolatum]|uniref:NADH dehydrogenase [ubiquinone] 1 beta subcomplex subunit 6-like n=1 Tax=Branchiostoma lanceolatum TaxID=7740 RepID=UPI0034560BD9
MAPLSEAREREIEEWRQARSKIRAERHAFLKDQVLAPNEPLPPKNQGLSVRWSAWWATQGTKFVPAVVQTPVRKGGMFFLKWVVPIWFGHYMFKYHFLGKDDGMLGVAYRRPRVYPNDSKFNPPPAPGEA